MDDDAGMRKSLRWLIRSIDLPVVTYDSAQEFLDDYDSDRPGCVLLDIRMPGMSGLQLQELLLERRAEIPVIIISGHGDVPTAVRALKAGAFDFFEKPFNGQQLLDRVREAILLDADRRRARAESDAVAARMERLTRREREVLSLVVAGKSSKVIAGDLAISANTVENHRAQIMIKMEAGSVADLVRSVVASGLDPATADPPSRTRRSGTPEI